MSEENFERSEILSLTTEIVSSHVANNPVPISELPELIKSVYSVLADLVNDEVVLSHDLKPAVPIRNSVTDDYVICLEDGKKLKMLKRHLKTAYNMTPDQYRDRWNLPSDYPMVAPNYALRRQELAKKIGLGRHRDRETRARAS
jgi:predicted transcriptional regulator